MRKHLLAILCLSLSISSFSQQGDGGKPKGIKFGADIRDMDAYTLAKPNIQALRAEDALNDKAGTGPWRFGFNHYTNYTLTNSGTWSTLPNGGKVWQIMLTAEEALTINLTFEDLSIPEGCELFIYNKEKSFVLGKFTAYHTYEGQLGAELIPGNTAIVEYYVPANSPQGSLKIAVVTHGYRTSEEYQEKAFGSSGNCNMNVNCADGAPWANQKRGALMLVSGSNGFCSGSLINNTQNDAKPYVLTANHCYSNPANWIFRFNWEATGCTNPGSSPSFVSLSGGAFRARRTPSDFCLVEITGGLSGGTVPASYNPYFNGWNNGNTAPTSSVSIHHPSGDIKKISFDDAASVAVQAMGSSEAASSWQIEWDRNTTTEGGSSGSPLFNQDGLIIGQLWGGGASCSNLSAYDYYGRLYNSWEPAGSNSTNQLKYWLDPNSTGVTSTPGYDPNAVSYALDARLSSIISPTNGTFCTSSFTPQVTIQNSGSSTLTTLSIRYRVDNGTEITYNWSGNLATNATANVSLANFNTTAGNHTFKVYTAAPNGGTDQNNANDTSIVSFEVLNPVGASLPLTEGFEGTTFPPTNWSLINNDNAGTWERTTTASSVGNASARKDNYNDDDAGQGDNLLTPYLSFAAQTSVTLNFDVAYARYSATYFDSLIVYATADCGNTWTRVYNKGNSTLATVSNNVTNGGFVPTAAQWRTETVDLSAFAGQSNVRILFQNISGYGQMLYIDNVNITGTGTNTPPTPNFTISDNTPCENQSITLSNTSTGATSYVWSMPNATPATSQDVNPVISYASAGTYTVTLTATNSNGSQQTQQTITVTAVPTAPNASSNSPVASGSTINLQASTVAGASYAWTGPNGYSSASQNPSFSANANSQGQYCVTATVNGCTSDISCTQVVVSGTSSIQENEPFLVSVFPNPSTGLVTIHSGTAGKLNVKVVDMTGKTVIQQFTSSEMQFTIDLTSFAKGIYLLSLENESGTVLRKLIKQ